MDLSRELEQLLAAARTEAVALGHSQVGSEHLLLALLTRRGSAAARLLRDNGWDPEALRRLLRARRGEGTPDLPLLHGLSSTAVEILAVAAGEARQMGETQVGTAHLLAAILRSGESTAARLLSENGTCLNCLFTELYETVYLHQTIHQTEERGVYMRLLEQFCEDLVERAPTMEPVIGREEEIETVIGILCRKNKNNPALIGEPGVGKTAVVEGLAQRMAQGKVPEQLKSKRLFSLNLASVLAGTKYRGEFEERVRDILAEIRRSGNVILFVDEMHTLVGAGAAEGAIDAANLLKPALGRGEVQILGATTLEEYRRHVEKDAALERRFRPVLVKEPDRETALEVLEGLRPGLEQHHRIRISRAALEAAVDLSRRYLPDHFLPDKAVDLLDEAAARAGNKRRGDMGGDEVQRQLKAELSLAVQENRFEHAATLRNKLQQLLRQQRGLFGKEQVEAEDVAAAVSRRTGILVGKLSQSDRERLLGLGEALSRQVMGQEQAVAAVTEAVCRGRMGLADERRPVASLMFLGPTGVGKTALCKVLADCVYGSADALIRLDMSEFMEQHTVSRLLGAPPGYVGHGEGGELTEKVRRRPYSVVLFDELEKAHRDVSSILLQVLEDGILTDSMGRHVDFRNTIVVMTTNLGSGRNNLEQVGFLGAASPEPAQQALREFFPPEFLGRLDAVVTFSPLSEEALSAIAKKELEETVCRARRAGLELTLGAETAACLARQCAKSKAGARELRRAIRSQIEAPAAKILLESEKKPRLFTAVEKDRITLVGE